MKFRAIQAFKEKKKKQNKTNINNLTYHLKESGKEKTKIKVSRTKEIINGREEINKIEIKIILKRSIKPKGDVSQRINKIKKCLHRLTNKGRERTQINKEER